ncbi:EthD family reductase [Burkholderia contaminans]|uniref:EthD family reductase n=1 Tax=Burkholderia contaminans TaxID=488447 RepID=UPI001589BADB|nr:EthD family reductase [Burkholderia contaminans]
MVFVVSYRRATGARFDARYYVEQHIPLVEKSWKPYGLESVDAFFPARQDSEVAVVAMCRFTDRAALDAAFASAGTADVMADIGAFTDIAPDRYITDVFSGVE